jgi:hypothetical protein
VREDGAVVGTKVDEAVVGTKVAVGEEVGDVVETKISVELRPDPAITMRSPFDNVTIACRTRAN